MIHRSTWVGRTEMQGSGKSFKSVFLISLVSFVSPLYLFQTTAHALLCPQLRHTHLCAVTPHLHALSFQMKELINLENPVCL